MTCWTKLLTLVFFTLTHLIFDPLTGVAPEGGREGYSPPSGNLSPPIGEKLTIRRETFTYEHIYTLYKL